MRFFVDNEEVEEEAFNRAEDAELKIYSRTVVETVRNSKGEEIEHRLFTDDYDPTPYCSWCGAEKFTQCKCPPRAEND